MAHPICGYLRPKIKEYVDAKGESSRWFSRQTGVDNTTIYRILNGEQKTLSFINAERIVKLLEPTQYLSILADFYPDEIKGKKAELIANTEALVSPLAKDLRLYEVYIFAAGAKATREQVKDKHGSAGIDRITILLELGMLSEIDGRFYDNLEGTLFPSEETNKRLASHNYDLISLDTPGTLAANYWGGLSPDGAIDWYITIQGCKEELKQILKEKAGDIVVACSFIAGPVGEKS
ncbi:MAG: hypothetical protein M3Q07_07980 [Pseudobdellovibrionaceae bacterium]|nr:hypothetical protein [Pseudobdellovibrionaceae bacterium]